VQISDRAWEKIRWHGMKIAESVARNIPCDFGLKRGRFGDWEDVGEGKPLVVSQNNSKKIKITGFAKITGNFGMRPRSCLS